MDISDIVEQIESTAEWRRGKAEQFPDDKRNVDVANWLEQLAKEIEELRGSDTARRIEEIWEVVLKNDYDIYRVSEWLNEALRAVGFHAAYDATFFLEQYREKLEELLQDEIDKAHEGDIPSPSLIEQVENDETVKAAKQAYELAYAKAFAVLGIDEGFEEEHSPLQLSNSIDLRSFGHQCFPFCDLIAAATTTNAISPSTKMRPGLICQLADCTAAEAAGADALSSASSACAVAR
jgi:hypothetical protein